MAVQQMSDDEEKHDDQGVLVPGVYVSRAATSQSSIVSIFIPARYGQETHIFIDGEVYCHIGRLSEPQARSRIEDTRAWRPEGERATIDDDSEG